MQEIDKLKAWQSFSLEMKNWLITKQWPVKTELRSQKKILSNVRLGDLNKNVN